MSLEYQPAAHAEEFCQKRVPCPYEKCLGKTICVIVLQKSHKFSIFKAGPYAQEFSCILRQTTNFCGSIWGMYLRCSCSPGYLRLASVHQKQNGCW